MANRPNLEKPTTIGTGGHRFWLYPASFRGQWLKRRRWVAFLLIVVFFVTPWTEVGGHQTVLMDLTERKFAVFGMVFWPQDTLIFWFLMAGGFVFFFFITAQWGRVWCGWACPQTVFLEHVFRRIEGWIEGDAQKRRKLDRGPLTWEKLWKKSLKLFLFLLISSHFANTVLCYFAGTDRVLAMTFGNPADQWGWFVFMALFNLLFFLDFAWFREQFCIIACPYGRFQSVLLDRDSTIVGYDTNRGEPRGVLRKNQVRDTQGDCIDCGRCVAVCPTGIDIRQGLQMECINCTACMDACDEIMDKIGKPRKLIGFTSVASLSGQARRFFRFRTLAYLMLLMVLWFSGGYLLVNKQDLRIQLLRPSGVSFSMVEERGSIANQFNVKATNKSDREWQLKARIQEGYRITAAFDPWHVKPQQTMVNPVFIESSTSSFEGGKRIVKLSFYDQDTLVYDTEVTLIGPVK